MFRSAIAAALVLAALASVTPLRVLAGNEEHQLVRGVRAGWDESLSTLSLELLLANGDRLKERFTDEVKIDRVLETLAIYAREKVSLYADVRDKRLVRLSFEIGSPIPYETKGLD